MFSRRLPADVVGLARDALAEDEVDRGAVVVDVEPLPDLLAVSVDGERDPVEGVRGEERDELLGILVRAVGVRTPRRRGVHAVRPDVRGDEEIASRLRRAVGARRAERVALERGASRLQIAVHLVGRDLDHPRSVVASPFEQRHRAVHVGAHEDRGVEHGAVDVGLGGEVDDGIAAGRRRGDRGPVGDVALDELDVEVGEVRRVPRVRQQIEDDDVVAAGDKPPHEVRADETGPAGDEHAHPVKGTRDGRTQPPGEGSGAERVEAGPETLAPVR